MGAQPAVFILPEDLELTSGPASHHRQYFDVYISQYNHNYLDNLVSYRKVISQRNRLLKDIGEKGGGHEQLDAWDKLLINDGSYIISERARLIEAIKDKVSNYYGIFDNVFSLTVAYNPHLSSRRLNVGQAHTDPETFARALADSRRRELRAGMTLIGPHRDRLEMNINGRSVRHFGSRGQKRCAMIAMKLAMADHLSEIRNEPVTLILDEVFAELDGSRSRALLKILSRFEQVFIATAGEFDFENFKLTRFNLNNGKIERG